MFKKAFWVSYEESDTYPTVEKAQAAIARHCEENGETYSFHGDNEVIINGRLYEIYRGLEPGSHGNYGVKCREK